MIIDFIINDFELKMSILLFICSQLFVVLKWLTANMHIMGKSAKALKHYGTRSLRYFCCLQHSDNESILHILYQQYEFLPLNLNMLLVWIIQEKICLQNVIHISITTPLSITEEYETEEFHKRIICSLLYRNIFNLSQQVVCSTIL